MLALFTVILGLIVQHTFTQTLHKCSCQCPYGTPQGYAYTTKNSVQACGKACIANPSNPCTPSNTYACLGSNCAQWQDSSAGLYKCSCRCGDSRGVWTGGNGNAYATKDAPGECGMACLAVPDNGCTTFNAMGCNKHGSCTLWVLGHDSDPTTTTTTTNQNLVAAGDITIPAGQVYYNNVVLNGNALHVHGTMKGRVSGSGRIIAYNGARLDGDVVGNQIHTFIRGHVTASGNIGGTVEVGR